MTAHCLGDTIFSLPDFGCVRLTLGCTVAVQEEYVLEHTPDILAALRQANVSLRWLLLHSFSRHRKLKAAVKSVLPAESEQLKLVLQIAQLEYQVVPTAGLLQ